MWQSYFKSRSRTSPTSPVNEFSKGITPYAAPPSATALNTSSKVANDFNFESGKTFFDAIWEKAPIVP